MSKTYTDLISRQAAIDLAKDLCVPTKDGSIYRHRCIDPDAIRELPSAQPVNYGSTNLIDFIDREGTLYGYNIEHLAMIANVMKAKKVTPEKVIEILTNVGEVVVICRAEFEESLRKAVERCWPSETATSFALTEKGDGDE